MIFFDLILMSIYRVFNKFSLSTNSNENMINSYIVSSGLQGLNFFNLFSFIDFYFKFNFFYYSFYVIGMILIFILNYIYFIRKERFDKILLKHKFKNYYFIILLFYFIFTFFVMFKISSLIVEQKI
jgi:hypothetical protein